MALNVPKRSQLSTINCNDSLSMTANTKLAIPALKSAKIASGFFSRSSSSSRCCLSHAPHASHIPCCSTATADSICHRQADAGAGRRLVSRADRRCKPSTRQSYRAEGGGAVAVQALWAWHGMAASMRRAVAHAQRILPAPKKTRRSKNMTHA